MILNLSPIPEGLALQKKTPFLAWHQTLQLFDESLILLQRVVLIVQELHAVAAQASRQQQRQDGAKANLGAK